MNNDTSKLDDSAINRLADLYLDFVGLPRHTLPYRRLKNAVILSALRFDDTEHVYDELAIVEQCSAAEIAQSVSDAITNLPSPIEDMFNEAYCNDADVGFMPKHKTAENIIGFLGKTFLYIIESNYPSTRL